MAIAKTTFGGLLEYATRPNETVILVQVRMRSCLAVSCELLRRGGCGVQQRFIP